MISVQLAILLTVTPCPSPIEHGPGVTTVYQCRLPEPHGPATPPFWWAGYQAAAKAEDARLVQVASVAAKPAKVAKKAGKKKGKGKKRGRRA